MPTPLPHLRAAAGACALFAVLSTQAQSTGDQLVDPAAARHQAAEIARGDPARWFQEDTTPEAQLRTKHKESAAALRENLNACKALPTPQRRGCMQQARVTYQQELTSARERIMATR